MRASEILPRPLQAPRVRQLLAAATQARVLVLGDVMLDHFLWGKVERISPEAPVPVVEFQRESFVPGGAGNVARNLAELNAYTELFGAVGADARAVLGDGGTRVRAVPHRVGRRGDESRRGFRRGR